MVDGDAGPSSRSMCVNALERRPGRPRRLDVDVLSERVGVFAELGLDLEHHAVLVQLREHDRDLPLAERVVERVVDQSAA